MNTEINPYAASNSSGAVAVAVGSERAGQLAPHWARLAAALIDGLLLYAQGTAFVVLVLGYKLQGGMRPRLGGDHILLLLAEEFIVFALINGYWLARGSQTLGKRLLGLRIVRSNGQRAEFMHVLLTRYLPQALFGVIPLLGTFLWMIDSLLIFRRDRRCLHDLIADTKVVHV